MKIINHGYVNKQSQDILTDYDDIFSILHYMYNIRNDSCLIRLETTDNKTIIIEINPWKYSNNNQNLEKAMLEQIPIVVKQEAEKIMNQMRLKAKLEKDLDNKKDNKKGKL